MARKANVGKIIRHCGQVLDSGAGFLVWFTQKSGASRGLPAVLQRRTATLLRFFTPIVDV